MALNYSLQMEARISPAELLSDVNRLTTIPFVSGEVLKDNLSRLTVSAHLENDKWDIEMCEKLFKFSIHLLKYRARKS